MKHNTHRFALISVATLALACSGCEIGDNPVGAITSFLNPGNKAAGTQQGTPPAQQAGIAVVAQQSQPMPEVASKPAAETPPIALPPQPAPQPAPQLAPQTAEGSTAAAAMDAMQPPSAPQPAASRSALPSTDPGTDRTDADEHTSLQRAARDGRLDSVKSLIERGSNVNYARPSNQCTALMYAAQNGHADIVRILLENGADANAVANENEGNRSALLYAVENNHSEIVKLLLVAGANPNHIDAGGNSSLTLATERDDINADIVSTLLAAGANASHADANKNTPLHHATYRGSAEAVRALLAKGADINALGQYGRSPIGLALDGKHKEIISALLDARPDLNSNETPTLELALTHYNHAEAAYWNDIIKRLIAGGANANAIVQKGKGCTWDGSTVLMSAVACGVTDAARLLIEGGADVNKAAESGAFKGLNALNIAVERKGYLDRGSNEAAAAQLVEMLRAAGARE